MIATRNSGLIVPLFVIVSSPWWWIIIQRDLLASLFVFILSFVVYLYFYQNKSRLVILLLVALTIGLFAISIKEAFDENIFRNSALDIQQLNKRHEFYAKGLGKFYRNRLVLTYFQHYNHAVSKLQQNFFSNLDPNLYFFASHPRERTGIEEFNKYFPVFLPFFLLGFFYIMSKLFFKFILYFIIISFISSVISPSYNLGPILFFPLINFIITVGLLITLSYLKAKRKYED